MSASEVADHFVVAGGAEVLQLVAFPPQVAQRSAFLGRQRDGCCLVEPLQCCVEGDALEVALLPLGLVGVLGVFEDVLDALALEPDFHQDLRGGLQVQHGVLQLSLVVCFQQFVDGSVEEVDAIEDWPKRQFGWWSPRRGRAHPLILRDGCMASGCADPCQQCQSDVALPLPSPRRIASRSSRSGVDGSAAASSARRRTCASNPVT